MDDVVNLKAVCARQVRELYAEATKRELELVAAHAVDVESIARHVWTGLLAARNMGLELGKYGLFPLTFEESERIVELVQAWFPDWTAAPVFYVDEPTIRGRGVYTQRELATILPAWFEMVAGHGARVVLIDTVEKSRGKRLLKAGPRDSTGILEASAIEQLDRVARALDVRAMWAGGINARQAYEFGRLGVFGIYVTTAVASAVAVGPAHESDPALAAERLPSREGVARVKLLIEAGFLSAKFGAADDTRAAALDSAARALLATLGAGGDPASDARRLWDLTADAWQAYRKS